MSSNCLGIISVRRYFVCFNRVRSIGWICAADMKTVRWLSSELAQFFRLTYLVAFCLGTEWPAASIVTYQVLRAGADGAWVALCWHGDRNNRRGHHMPLVNQALIKTVNCFCPDVFIKALPYRMDSHMVLTEQSCFCHLLRLCHFFSYVIILIIIYQL